MWISTFNSAVKAKVRVDTAARSISQSCASYWSLFKGSKLKNLKDTKGLSLGYPKSIIRLPSQQFMISSDLLIKNRKSQTKLILEKYLTADRIITPIGIDCYSSFVAKGIGLNNCKYIPSIFGFRSLDLNFFCKYTEAMSSDNPWLLPHQDIIESKYDLGDKIHVFENDPTIHQLNNIFGLFLLNHDGGSYSRPYTQEVLDKDVTDRLAYLELVTHTLFYEIGKKREIIFVASGPLAFREKIASSFQKYSSKFQSKFSLLFIHCRTPAPGSEPPKAKYFDGNIDLTFYKENSFYGNVAQNWSLLKLHTLALAEEMIVSDLTLNLTEQ